MKIRPSLLLLSALMIAFSFLVLRVATQQSKTVIAATPTSIQLTPEEQAEREQQASWYHKTFYHERAHNFRAKLNNRSKRSTLTVEQLNVPGEIREQARQIAKQYKNEIYPILTAYVAKNKGFLPIAAERVPELLPYIQDMEYKGTGSRMLSRGSWLLDIRYRLDGTFISRDVYSRLPANTHHDPWGYYDNFLDVPKQGEGFRITGWDDGVVTFDPTPSLFTGGMKTRTDREAGATSPGAAGIPPKDTETIKHFFDERKRITEQLRKARKEQKENKKP